MRYGATCAWLWLMLSAVCGCANPRTAVTVNYRMPPDVPVPVDPALVSVGTFRVTQGQDGWAAEYLAGEFARRLADRSVQAASQPAGVAPSSQATSQAATQPNVMPSPAELTAPVNVSADVYLDVREATSQRAIRQMDTGRNLTTVPAPTRVITVSARVDFVVRMGQGRSFTVETRRLYDSRLDQASFGPLGLDRPDQPGAAPSRDQAVKRTLDLCLETFCDMIQPTEVHQQVPLWPLTCDGSSAVMDLAAKGRYAQAADALRHATPRPGDMAYAYDLAVLEEACGRREQALAGYQQVSRAGTVQATAARQGMIRLRLAALLPTAPASKPPPPGR